MSADSAIRIGTSGWSYRDWVGNLYPEKTEPREYLGEYARHFGTVEIDATFYAAPKRSMCEVWRDRTPPGFVFAAKVPQSMTHEKQLHDCGDELTAFLRVMDILGDKLGPLLFQFPYTFKADGYAALERFLPLLPRDHHRFAVEMRHKSWLRTPLPKLLERYNIALVLVDHPWFPRSDRSTADFAYVRWLGDRNRIREDFSHERFTRDDDLRWWAERFPAISAGGERRIFGYFNNHYTGHSPTTARRFLALLSEGGATSASPASDDSREVGANFPLTPDGAGT